MAREEVDYSSLLQAMTCEQTNPKDNVIESPRPNRVDKLTCDKVELETGLHAINQRNFREEYSMGPRTKTMRWQRICEIAEKCNVDPNVIVLALGDADLPRGNHVPTSLKFLAQAISHRQTILNLNADDHELHIFRRADVPDLQYSDAVPSHVLDSIVEDE